MILSFSTRSIVVAIFVTSPLQLTAQDSIHTLPEIEFRHAPDPVKRKLTRPVVKYAPAFLGGESALKKYIQTNVKYPVNALRMGIEGTVKIAFTVRHTGEVVDVRIERGIGSDCDVEAFRAVQAMPKWEPAVYENYKVSATASVMISFNAENNKVSYVPPSTMENSYVVAESSPEFVGGYTAMMEFIQKNIKWPAARVKEKKQGAIHLTFLVLRDGSIKDVKVLKGVHPEIDAAAINVVRAMPKWKPGQQNGKTIDVRYNLPIRFGTATNDSKK